MDISEYLPMFLAEAREHLQELNLAIVRIEEQPDDRATVDEIFRIAHSVKGMSATMGFAEIAALTHEMENVLELLRQRRGGLPHEAIDVLLGCLDALDASVDSIEADGAERLDAAPLIERLKLLVRIDEGAAKPEPGEAEPEPDLPADAPLVHVRAELAKDALMPSVRAFQVFAALAEHGTVVRSAPPESALEGWEGRVVEAWVQTPHEPEALRQAVLEVSDVAGAAAADAGAEAASAATPAAHGAGRKGGAATVRVDAERLDQLMHLMGELVVHRTHVESLAVQADLPELQHAMQDLTRSSQALQQMVMQVRMIPVEAVFLRFQRLVRDLSSKLEKQVELVLTGQDTELDRTVVDALGDPIVHLVRNSLDHGLEGPAERQAAGKPPTGTLEISARHAGGNVVISVRDDGRGIDPARVARKAVERGLLPSDAGESIDMHRAIELLFAAGFSTADETSDISGRGVGMDAVRNSIRELGGEVLVTSEHG